MNGLSLFSGTAIGELAFKHIIPNYKTVGYVEWNNYDQEVIRARIADGVIDDAPIFGDIREFNTRFASLYAGKVDWLSAGFPCQPFSVAGNRLGEADERNQWPATRDAISIIRPRYVLLENVSGLLIHDYIRIIFGELAEIGYDCEWDIMSPCFIGGSHTRTRLWVLAYPSENRRRFLQNDSTFCRTGGSSTTLHNRANKDSWSTLPNAQFWRGPNGIPKWVGDSWSAIGNGWVPQVVRRILKIGEPG